MLHDLAEVEWNAIVFFSSSATWWVTAAFETFYSVFTGFRNRFGPDYGRAITALRFESTLHTSVTVKCAVLMS